MTRKLSWMLLLLLMVSLFSCAPRVAIKDFASSDIRQEPSVITWEKDGSEMVLIPGGFFEMGDHSGKRKNALPVHAVELDPFYMDKTEVNIGQFKRFVRVTGHRYDRWDDISRFSPTDKHPMRFVSWHDAMACAQWVGKRFPTEAEWERAARGGLESELFPWGKVERVTKLYAHININLKTDFSNETIPVGSLAPNNYGLHNMAGNVYEWCLDSPQSYEWTRGKNPGFGGGAYP